jgi:hypothetical protein
LPAAFGNDILRVDDRIDRSRSWYLRSARAPLEAMVHPQ